LLILYVADPVML